METMLKVERLCEKVVVVSLLTCLPFQTQSHASHIFVRLSKKLLFSGIC